MSKIQRKLLILSTGRGGTKYAATFLRRGGLEIGHERLLAHGTCSMYFCHPDLDTTKALSDDIIGHYGVHKGDPSRTNIEFDEIWRLVRDPLRTIDSLAKTFNGTMRRWTIRHYGVADLGASSSRCSMDVKYAWAMRYHTRTQELISLQNADHVIKVEELASSWDFISEKFSFVRPAPSSIPTTINRGLRFAFKSKDQSAVIRATLYDTTWEQLAKIDIDYAARLRSFANLWGYHYD